MRRPALSQWLMMSHVLAWTGVAVLAAAAGAALKLQWDQQPVPPYLNRPTIYIFGLAMLLAGVVANMSYHHRKTSRRSRLRRGLCLACGYDLRASPEQCPECGAVRE